jgi:hypothetical protein
MVVISFNVSYRNMPGKTGKPGKTSARIVDNPAYRTKALLLEEVCPVLPDC